MRRYNELYFISSLLRILICNYINFTDFKIKYVILICSSPFIFKIMDL